MPTVIFSNTTHTICAQRVYMRRFWGANPGTGQDPDPWVLQSHLHCVEASWSVAPTIPTATLVWRFGDSILQPDDATHTFQAYDRKLIGKQTGRYFVKIEFDVDDPIGTKRIWVGTCEITEEQYGGIRPYLGEQTITCYGMERLLDSDPILSTTWYDITNVTNQITKRAHAFNRGGIGNKSPNPHGTSYVFYPDLDNAQKWNSREIVEYLIATQKPQDKDGGNPINIFLTAGPNTIPTFDEPEIEQEGQTLYGLLDRIINRHRLLVWYINYVENTNALEIRVMTMASVDVNLPGSLPAAIAANSSQLDWQFDGDPLTTHAISQSDVEKYDQVVCQGARMISVGSFSKTDSTIENGWKTADETAYEQAASVVSGYADLTREQKQRRNAEVRDRPGLEDVYSVFRIPHTWNRKVKDGIGGTANPFFPVVNSAPPPDVQPNPYPVYFPTMFIEQTLPLIVGVDYSGTAISSIDPATGKKISTYVEPLKNREEMSPLAFFKRPGSSSPERWILAERIGDAAELERVSDDEAIFSCFVNVLHDSQAVRIRVTGKPQHAIAKTAFTKLADDPDPGGYDYATMILTLAIADDRNVEGAWPPTVSATTGTVVKRKYLDCGDRYRKIYVAPGTVVGVEVNGALKRSTNGGFIPVDNDEDDEHKLINLARIAYEWYGRTRYVLALQTYRMPDVDDVNLGMLVTSVGDPGSPPTTPAALTRRTINSIITQIQIHSPLGSGQEGDPCPSMQVLTWAGELDPLQLAPKYLEPVRRDHYRDEQPRHIARPRYSSKESSQFNTLQTLSGKTVLGNNRYD